MKQIIYLLAFIILSYGAYANYAGETINIITLDNCYDSIKVNVTATFQIDDNEYELKDCNQTINNYWICNCPNIDLVTKLNTINNYTFDITYTETHTNSVTSGGSRSYSRPSYTISRLIQIDNSTKDKNIIVKKPIHSSVTNIPVTTIKQITTTSITLTEVTSTTLIKTNVKEDIITDMELKNNKSLIIAIILTVFVGIGSAAYMLFNNKVTDD